jgi:hypothetical protein
MPSYGEYGYDESAARGTGPAAMTPEQEEYQRRINAEWRAANPDAVARGMGTPGGGGLGSAFGRVKDAAAFELDRAGNLIKSVAHNPGQALTGGIDPIGTRIGNAITGSNNQALVGQLGGATENDFNRYEQSHGFGSLGAARGMSTSADYIAGMMGAAGAANGIGNAFNMGSAGGAVGQGGQSIAPGTVAANTAQASGTLSTLPEIVVTGQAGGAGLGSAAGGLAGGAAGGNNGWQNTDDPMGSFANFQTGGNASQLAQSGAIGGGAGAGLGASITEWGGRIKDALGLMNSGSGGNGGGSRPSYSMPNLAGMLGSQTQAQPQPSLPAYLQLPTNTPYYMPTRGYNQHDFLGSKVWT